MSVFATVYKEMQVPASEVRGPYVNDDPYQEEDTGPEHTADLVYNSASSKWMRVVKVTGAIESSILTVITLEGAEAEVAAYRWVPIDILRPVHQPPFEAGLSGYHL